MAIPAWTTRCLSLAAVALTLVACGHPAGPTASERSTGVAHVASVSSGFLWGVSTAGYQWEGGDHSSQWAAWDAAHKTKERIGNAANGYALYDQDAQLSQGLGCNAFRTSIEWARIEPQEGVIDGAAVQHYHDLLNSLHAHGLKPVITLMHFAYPAWLDAQGGWENPATAAKFEAYAAFVAREFGAQVDTYLTFNEPNIFLAGGYVSGQTPPGKQDPIAGLRAMNNMIHAHGLAYDAIHAARPGARVSFNMYTAEYVVGPAAANSPEEQAKQTICSDQAFVDQAMGPEFMKTHRAIRSASSKLDFAAFDYYCKLHVWLPFALPRPDRWDIYPEGMYNAVKRFHSRYGLPVLVAENGIATWNHQKRADHWTRSAYTVAHVEQMQRAIKEGVPVLGYMQWSITDNYEWGSFGPCFGLFSVDCRNQNYARVPTDGVAAIRAIIGSGGVTPAIAHQYPAPTQN